MNTKKNVFLFIMASALALSAQNTKAPTGMPKKTDTKSVDKPKLPPKLVEVIDKKNDAENLFWIIFSTNLSNSCFLLFAAN